MPEYKATLSSARAHAEAGRTDAWVHRYLNGEGRNAPFSEGLKLCKRYYVGPARFPLRLFRRITGPEAEMPYRVDAGGWAARVAGLEAAIHRDADLPPLIVHYVAGDFELNDGNHRWQAYQNVGSESAWAIVWITEAAEKEEFLVRYGEYVQGCAVVRG